MTGSGNGSLALKSDGTVWAWGASGGGFYPAQVQGLSSVTGIAAGSMHYLACKSDGTLWAWGYGRYGQLGNNSYFDSNVPIQVIGLSDVVAVSACNLQSMALKSDGTVWSWGIKTWYWSGDDEHAWNGVPTQVDGLSGVTAIAAGALHGVALKGDGTVWSWGYNIWGELGNNSHDPSSAAVQVTDSNGVALSGVTAIAAGALHSLALKNDGTVWAWGFNGDGQLANDNWESLVADQVIGLDSVTAIECGESHSLALKNDATVWAWGSNSHGQLGNNSTVLSMVPVQVSELTGVTAIGAGDNFSLALSTQVSSAPFARNDSAVTYKNASVIVTVLANDVDGDGDRLTVTALGATANGGTAKINNGQTVTYIPPADYLGDDSFSYTVTDAQGHTATAMVTVSLRDNGNVVAWGANGAGQLGNGTDTDSAMPTSVSKLNDVVSLAAGSSHSLALRSDGTVWAWGSSYFGQVGDGTFYRDYEPTRVLNLSGVVAIAAGDSQSLAIRNDGTVWAWGMVAGDTKSSVPVQMSTLSGITGVSAGEFFSLALKNDGTVWAWDVNNYKGTTYGNVPVQVGGLKGITAIAAGASAAGAYGNHSVALKSDGTVWTWGFNHETPVQVANLNNVAAIAASGTSFLALKTDGTLWVWGLDVNNEELRQIGTNIVAISSGYQSMALKDDGTALIIDRNSLSASQINNLSGVKACVSGAGFGLAILGAWSGAGDADDGIAGPSGKWTTNSNWAGNAAPAPDQVAAIQLPGNYSVLLDQNATSRTLQLGSRDATLGETSLDLGGNTLTLTSTNGAKIHEGGTVTGSGTIGGNLTLDGTIAPAPVVSSGTLSARTLTARSAMPRSLTARSAVAGSLAAGSKSGIAGLIGSLTGSDVGGNVVVAGNVNSSATSQVDLVIGGSGNGQYDQCVASGVWSLGGTLNVQFADGFSPIAGDTFEIIRAKQVIFDFQTKNFPQISGLDFTLQKISNYNATYPGTVSYVLVAGITSPVITEISPSHGRSGDQVTLTGKYFTGASEVRFLGNAASSSDDKIAVLPQPGANFTDTLIKLNVPVGTATGLVRVTRDGKTGTSRSVFTVDGAPNIESFTPVGGPPGTPVTITGTNFTGTKTVAFNDLSSGSLVTDISNAAAGFQIVSDTSIIAKVPSAATTGKISVTTAESTTTTADIFTVAPTITNFIPGPVVGGNLLSIYGKNFTGVTLVKFNGLSAGNVVADVSGTQTGFQIVSNTQIRVRVPVAATSGYLSVTNAGGTAISSDVFYALPGITGFTPSGGPVGSTITITGVCFNGTTAVKFNGLSAGVLVNDITAATAGYQIVSATEIAAIVPSGATSGKISVTTPSGTATSTNAFTVAPTVSGFTPTSGNSGTIVAINGSNFSKATVVKFNGASSGSVVTDINAATTGFQIVSDTQIKTKVPVTATTGPISVTNAGGTGSSADSFSVLPGILSFTPASGVVGTTVTITGTNFTDVTSTKFNGTSATFTVKSATQITAKVPAGARTGKISLTSPGGSVSSINDFIVVNRVPVAKAESATTLQATPLDINVLSNDSDPDGDQLTISAVTQGNGGLVEIVEAGAKLRYTPGSSFAGADSFTYTASDGLLTATATVSVNVRALRLTINDVVATETNSGTTNAVFTVMLSESSTQTVNVHYDATDGTAAVGSDYTSTGGTLTFAPGQTTQTVTVPIIGDVLSEADETFFVNLSAPTNAGIADGQGLGTITNDDLPPSVSIGDAIVTEGNSGTVNVTLLVKLSAASGRTITVTYATGTPGSSAAIADIDYIAVPLTTLTFNPGETSKPVTVQVKGDTTDEVDERFAVNLSSPTNVTLGDKEGVGTIVDDDAAPGIVIDDVTVTEGSSQAVPIGTTPATFTVSLSAPSGKTVTVQYNTATPGTIPAIADIDYVAVPATTITFLPGEISKQITVTVNADLLDEDVERFTVNLKSAGNATITDREGFCTINDDDTIPSLRINDVSLAEGNSGTTAFTFTVTLSSASGKSVSVKYQTTNPSSIPATAGVDYAAVPLTVLTFAPGETSKQITVLVNGDTTMEGTERFIVKLSSQVNSTIADAEGFGTITNDDAAALLFENDAPSQ